MSKVHTKGGKEKRIVIILWEDKVWILFNTMESYIVADVKSFSRYCILMRLFRLLALFFSDIFTYEFFESRGWSIVAVITIAVCNCMVYVILVFGTQCFKGNPMIFHDFYQSCKYSTFIKCVFHPISFFHKFGWQNHPIRKKHEYTNNGNKNS